MTRASKWEQLNGSFDQVVIPAVSGVYVVYANAKVIYVGQSRNIRARFSNYNILFEYDPISPRWTTPWGQFWKFKVKVSTGGPYGCWAMRELRLIKRLKPEFNVAYGDRPPRKKNG